MRYSADDLMNDSWVISGPLITGQSYFCNANVKSILSKNLASRNKLTISTKRPNTTADVNYASQTGRNRMVVSQNRFGSSTHYKGFGETFLKRSLDVNGNDNNSISVSIKHQFSTNNEKSAYETINEQNVEQDPKPGSSYFKSRVPKNNSDKPFILAKTTHPFLMRRGVKN